MFGPLGLPELLLIFALIFILFGPDKLPRFARLLAKTIRIAKESIDEAKQTISQELEEVAPSDDLQSLKNEVTEIVNSINKTELEMQTSTKNSPFYWKDNLDPYHQEEDGKES